VNGDEADWLDGVLAGVLVDGDDLLRDLVYVIFHGAELVCESILISPGVLLTALEAVDLPGQQRDIVGALQFMALLAQALDLLDAALPITEEFQDDNEKEVRPDHCDECCENGSEGIAGDKDRLTNGIVDVHVVVVWVWKFLISVKVEVRVS
jgi:hypothetical protein